MKTQDLTDNQSAASSSHRDRPPHRLPVLPGASVTDLPVSIKGGVVERRVSSAVHAIHIRASPDTVKKKRGLLEANHSTQQTNTALPFLIILKPWA